jgi:hypothetical protein
VNNAFLLNFGRWSAAFLFLASFSLPDDASARTQKNGNRSAVLQGSGQAGQRPFVIYNLGTQFVSLAAANPQQIRETRFAIKFTYSFLP